MTGLTITAEPGLPYLDLSREFAAPRDVLYRAHTDPDLLAQWVGPRRLTMTVERYEVRDGGVWRYTHSEPDGTAYGFHGVFHGTPSVEDGIVQTFEFDGLPGHVSLERLTFEERDGRTTLRIHSVFQSVADRDGMVASGMESGLIDGYVRLDALIARGLPVA